MRIKITLTLLACFACLTAFSQNWEAFTSGRTYHYRSDTATALPDQSIHFDEVTVLAADSVFSVARRFVFPVDTSQRNQPMFCGRDIRSFTDGTFNFKNPGNYALPTHAGVGSNFTLDSISGLTASVTRVYHGMVLGLTLDSIKVFTTNTLDSLVLSKAHGILEWPASMGGAHFMLRGIQEDNFGEVLPGFDGFFNYQAGADYYFESELYQGQLLDQRDVFRVRFKVDTNQRVIGGNHIVYSGMVRHTLIEFGSITSVSVTPMSGTIMLEDRPNSILRKSHHEQVRAPQMLGGLKLPSPWATYNMTTAADSTYPDWNGMWTTMTYQRNAGKTELHLGRSNGATGWLYYGIGGDTCARSGYDQMRTTIREGMGIVHSEWASFLNSGHFDLVGSIVNGDTVGTIIPDSVLLATTQPAQAGITWNAYPNPAQDQLNVQWKDVKTGELQLMDLAGKVVYAQRTQGLAATIDVHTLPAGMYLLSLTQSGLRATQRVVIAH